MKGSIHECEGTVEEVLESKGGRETGGLKKERGKRERRG